MTEQNSLTDMVQVDVQLPTLTVNFEAMKQALTNEVAKYGDVVVTPETISEAREKAKEINATRKVIDQVRKERRKEAMAPIEQFDSDMKSLTGICDEAREKITSQIDQFDQRRLEACGKLLKDALSKAWDDKEVRDDQRRASIDDLVKLGNLTGTDNLTKAAQQTVESRAQEDRTRQDKVERRLLELENRSHRAGLSAPLTRDHVHQWLEADDETYEGELQRILDAEIQREEQAEARRRQQWEKEQREKEAREQAEREQAERERQERLNTPEKAAEDAADGEKAGHPAGDTDETPSPEGQPVRPEVSQRQEAPAPQGQPSPAGHVEVVLTCTFRTQVPAEVTDERLDAELRRKLAAAGITSLESIQIEREVQAA